MQNKLDTSFLINNLDTLNVAILKGIDFLYSNQLNCGEFKTLVSPTEQMELSYNLPANSPYITTFVLYSLSFLKHIKVREMIRKSLNFLIGDLEESGVWRFYSKHNRKIRYCNGRFFRDEIGIIPDLDDTACASYALKSNQVLFNDNQEIFINQRNEQGIFYTWFLEDYQWEAQQKSFIYVPPYNNICSGVNANILLYLGENETTKNTCNYLNNVILSGQERYNCVYFPNNIVFYYLLSRAYFNGIRSLSISKDVIVNKILSHKHDSHLMQDPLSNALAICTLFNFGYFSSSIQDLVDNIIITQKSDGCWEKKSFFIDTENHYGSEALTTAICLESLAKYYEYSRN